ncbi:fimbrial protein [Porphyromonas cangingivalis]|uniref:fimbrial protein n=1 Tax=Porphyromonas cangingivalis TaxID=36874 RepID=UPI002431CC90|nr:fimbrial protein [Porphyromonas cangingivalis]
MKVMKEKAYMLFLLIGILLLAGCKETPSDPAGEEATISLVLGDTRIRGGDLFVGDDVISKVRVYVFSGSHIEAMQVFNAGELAFENPFRVKCVTGEKSIFVVANEPAAVSDRLNEVKTPSDLDAIKLETDSFLPKPLTMVGNGTVNIDSSTGAMVSISLKRVVAKITLKIRNASTGPASLSLLGVELHRGMKSTPLIEGASPAPHNFWNKRNDYSAPQEVTAEGFQVWSSDDAVYLFENLGSVSDTTSRATSLVIHAKYNDVNTKYRAYINDENSEGADHRYSIKRNYCYNLIADIKNLGESDGITLRTEVRPWEVVGNDLLFKRVYSITPHPTFEQKTFEVATPGDEVEFKFKLMNPVEALWRVQLTNPIHFEALTTGGAVVSGGVGQEYTIKIRPRQPQSDQAHTTEIFITVDDAEIPLLKNNTAIGIGNRIVIKQPMVSTP